MAEETRNPEEGAHSDAVGSLGEDAVVARLVAMIPERSDIVAGPGDDCAVVEGRGGVWQLLKTDCLVEGVHFSAGTDPVLVGRKAIHRAVSDVASMGGQPDYVLVTLAMDSGRSIDEVEGWYRGMVEAAESCGCALVGGETSRLPREGAVISVAMTGSVLPEQCVFRRGASVGDIIAVTGRLGGSLESGRHLTFTPRLKEARWLVANAKPTSMMDLSDGLGSDLPRLATAGGLGYQVDLSRLPLHKGASVEAAVTEGEDYELLLTFAVDRFAEIVGRWQAAFPETPLTAIGEITETTAQPLSRGWEHYHDE